MGYFIRRDSDLVTYRSWESPERLGAKMRVLVLKLDHVGDFWMSLGPLKELRRRFAEAHVTLVVGSWNIDTARQFELADEYVAFDFFPRNPTLSKKRKGADDIRTLLTGVFDIAIDMRVPDDTRAVLLAVPARHHAAIADQYRLPEVDIAIAPFNLKLRRPLFYKLAQHIGLAHGVPRMWLDWFADSRQAQLQHVTEILFFLVAKTAAYFDDKSQASQERKFTTGKLPPVVLAPFSNSSLRDWPVENFGRIAAALSMRGDVILVGRGESLAALETVADAARAHGAADVQMAVDLSELEFNRLMNSAGLVVSNNSGAGHVAAQLGRPTIGIFSASHLPELWGFQGPLVSMLMSAIECRGCGMDVVKRCPIGVRCKSDITPDHVLAEIDALMNHVRSSTPDAALRADLRQRA